MKQIKQMLSRKVFRTFLFSFLLAFVLPLCLLAIMLVSLLDGMQEEQNVNSRLALEQYRAGTDGQLYAVMRGGDNLMVNEKLRYFSTIGDPLEYTTNAACFTMLRSLMQDVSTLTMSNGDIESAYIYFTNSGSVVSSSFMTADVYYRRNLQNEFSSPGEWQAFLSQRQNGFVRRSGQNGDGSISYMRTSLRGDVVLVINMNLRGVLNGQDVLPRDARCAIYGRDHSLLYTDGEVFPAIADAKWLSAMSGEEEALLGERSHIVWRASANTRCLYLTAAPHAQYYAQLNQTRLMSGLALLLLFLGCGYLSYFLAKKRYEPIDRLRARIAPSDAEPGATRDDFADLQDMLEGMQSEGLSIRQRLKANNRNMEHFVLEQLMRGNYSSIKSEEEQLLSLDIVFDGNLFVIVGVRIDSMLPPDSPTDDPVKLEESRQLTRFVVRNVLEDVLSTYSPLALELSNRMYLLLCPDDGADWNEALTPLINQSSQVLKEHYDMMLSVSVSQRVEGMHNIRFAYAWAREALNRAAKGSFSCAWLAEEPPENASERLLQAVDLIGHKMEQFIAAGDEASLQNELQALRAECAGNSSWSVRLALSALLSDLCKAFLPRLSQEDGARLDKELRRFMDAPPSPDDLGVTESVLLTLYTAAAAISNNERNEDIAQRALRYIERHYVESSLNVSMVADQLGLTPSYASSLFKRQTGQSMLDTINLTRIRHACELLKGSKLGLEEIAEQTGYYNASTFIRVFKKYEGLTPGQYRAAHEREAKA